MPLCLRARPTLGEKLARGQETEAECVGVGTKAAGLGVVHLDKPWHEVIFNEN